jgi:lactoylglutathione lyase
MKLAKPHLDVAVMTDRIEPMLAFWQGQVGLVFEEELPTGRGNVQHRHALNGSVFKLNHSPALPDAPATGIRELWIARDDLDAPRALSDPDGSSVRLVPRGEGGIEGVAVRIAGRDLEALRHFYGDVLELEEVGPTTFRCGDSLLFLEEDPEAPLDAGLAGRGYRYLTIQVFGCEAEHRRILQAGAREGMPPHRGGNVAIFSMVLDPAGNWIEISQRASLTGPLDG